MPEKSWLQTLRKKVATGRTTAMKGRVGRELTEEEKRECAEQLAAMEEKRKRGIQSRKEARETLQNSRDLKEGQAELKQGQDEIKGAIGRVEQKFDQLLGAAGSSKHHREMAKEAAKREREEAKAAAKCERQEAKERQLLRAGLQVEDGDRVVDGVLVKAGLPLEGFEGLDLGAKFELCGLRCCRISIGGGAHRAPVPRQGKRRPVPVSGPQRARASEDHGLRAEQQALH